MPCDMRPCAPPRLCHPCNVDSEWDWGQASMPDSERETLLLTLKRELEFLEQGKYREPMAWRPSMIFEDSPICLRGENSNCVEANCFLMQLVPAKERDRRTPCRHIPLNDKGETVDSFYRTGTTDELEAALRLWLNGKIKELEG
jgi:hypothetical protein